MPHRSESPETGLDHVVVVGGTPHDWLKMSGREWRQRLESVAVGAAAGGARWVSVLPHHGENFSSEDEDVFRTALLETTGVLSVESSSRRFMWKRDDRLTVIVDCNADGRMRFAHTIENLRKAGVDASSLTEESISEAVLAPATAEADLVVGIGPPDRIPKSLIWELAYSELVFLDIHWEDLISSHIELAIDDFNRRHRRFGGLDS